MKKSLFAAALSSVLLFSACEDQEHGASAENLPQAGQSIAQLNTEIAKSQQELTALTSENQAAAEKQQQAVPALAVEIYPFFAKAERVKFDRKEPTEDYAILSAEQYYFVSLAKTGVAWLDNLLAKQVLLTYERALTGDETKADRNAVTGNELMQLKVTLEKVYDESLATLKQGATLGISSTVETIYLGQRHNIVTFFQNYDEYTGGAHNNYYTKYFNIDVNKKRIISLDDLLSKAKQVELAGMLWDDYEQMSPPDAQGKHETFTPKRDFYISEDFLFTDDGVKFIYPPYALGPFSEGEISLTVPWYEINQLLNPEYQRTPKDGYDLAPPRPAKD